VQGRSGSDRTVAPIDPGGAHAVIASMAILQKAALKESGRLISDDDLGNAAWKQLKEDSGPEWWKSIPPEMLKSLKPEYLADIPPEAFEELNISGID